MPAVCCPLLAFSTNHLRAFEQSLPGKEELTLHIIEMDKRMDKLEAENAKLKKNR